MWLLSRQAITATSSPCGYVSASPCGYVSSSPCGYVSASPCGYVSSSPCGYVSASPCGYVSSSPRGFVFSSPCGYVSSSHLRLLRSTRKKAKPLQSLMASTCLKHILLSWLQSFFCLMSPGCLYTVDLCECFHAR